MLVKERLEQIQKRIQEAQTRSPHATSGDVNIIAVTKYVSTEVANEVVRAGCLHIGENRWPDAKEKVEQLQGQAQLHFIGHLQSKKARHVIQHFSHIHSLDRLSLAKELDKRAEALDTTVHCFVQANVSGEESKFGLSPDEVLPFMRQLNDFPRIKVHGLMTMAPFVDDPEETRPVFRSLRQLRDQLNEQAVYRTPIPELSMGMSNDFEVAVEEGATWVRLGTVLVG